MKKYFLLLVAFTLNLFGMFQSNLQATITNPASFQAGPSLIVVNQADSLLTDIVAQQTFFDYVQKQNIRHVFFQARQYTSDGSLTIKTDYLEGSQASLLQAFVKQLHTLNTQVILYDGNELWLEPQYNYLGIESVCALVTYNEAAPSGSAFDGIHYDILPNKLGAIWRQNIANGKDNYNDQLENSYLWILNSARQILKDSNLATLTLSITLNDDYAYYVTDLITPLYAATSPLDFVVVDQAFTTSAIALNGSGGIGGVKNNLALTKSIPMIFAMAIPATANVTTVKNVISKIQTQYFSNANMLGIALDNYSTVANLDLSNGTPTPPTPPTTTTSRSMWVWGYTNILANATETQQLFTFVKAPFGNANAAINRIFLEVDPSYFTGTNSSLLKNFIATASAQNLKVELLAGDAQWALTANRSVPVNLCSQVLAYNASVPANQRFSGIHLDIEPHTLGAIWHQNTSAGKDNYNDELENNMLFIFQSCRQLIKNSGQNFTLAADIGTDYAQYVTDMMVPLLATTSPLDYMTIMNYFDNYTDFVNGTGGIGGVINNLKLTSIPLVFGIETGPPSIAPGSISFYQEGNAAMEAVIAQVLQNFKTDPHFAGFAIHHWESYRTLKP